MSEWQDIESAPKRLDHKGATSGPVILLGSTFGHRAVGYWGKGINPDGAEGWINVHDHMPMRYWNQFTHWMPIPDLNK